MVELAIVILNFRSREETITCVRSLLPALAVCPFSAQVVVVDNDSGDGILEWLQVNHPEILGMQSGGNIGMGRGMNLGMAAVGANYYLALNADTVIRDVQTIVNLHQWMEEHPAVGLCGPRLANDDGSLQYSCYRFPGFFIQPLRRFSWSTWPPIKKRIDRFLMKEWEHMTPRPVDWVMGSALLVRAAAMQTVGMFDETFWMYYEDTDWCRRFWQNGWLVYYVPTVTVQHHHGRVSAKVPGTIKPLFTNRVAREHVKSWLCYFWKWRHDVLPIKFL